MADLKPAYLIQGDDAVLIDAWRARVRARAREEGPTTTLEVLRDERLSPESVAEAIGALTLSVGRRYVVADGVEGWKDKDVAPVAQALESLPSDTVIVLIAEGKVTKRRGQVEKWPAGAALQKAVEKAGGEVRGCVAPSDYAKWVVEQGRDLGLTVDRAAAEVIVERTPREESQSNPRQRRLLRELEKLACFSVDGKVDSDSVEALTVPDVEGRAYELADAIVQGEAERALLLAEDLRDRGTEIMHILFALLRQLRNIRQAWAMVELGKSTQEIAGALRVPPFIAKRIAAQAERVDGERMERVLGDLAELDYAVRGAGKLDPQTALTLTVARAA